LSRSTLRRFWSSYRRSRLGLIGLSILSFFLFVAIFAPVLTPYDPLGDRFLAEGVALPSWYRIFPQYRDFPSTMDFSVSPKVDSGNWSIRTEEPFKVVRSDPLTFTFLTANASKMSANVEMTHQFGYEYAPPLSFQVNTDFRFNAVKNSTYQLQLFITDPGSNRFMIWSSGPRTGPLEPSQLNLDSKGLPFEYKAEMGLEWYQNVAVRVFSKKGLYSLMIRFQANGSTAGPSILNVTMSRLVIHVPGRVHGILGTDHLGADLFSQLLYGTRVSLLIGVSAALLSVIIGLGVGLVSGYQGGIADEASMRLVDVLLVLPGLPMLMILSGLFGRNIWNIVFLLGILSWPGFARLVRAQVLQLKTATFVEASRAIGSSSRWIILRHLLPNVLPLAYATIALYIPGAIITEAALSFLALGDPNTASWGRMFYSANAFGAFQNLAWWWIIPPGVAITFLSISFVFIGTTMDEILNPRIRARR
jgi:peptide/nickel transport system permease protein